MSQTLRHPEILDIARKEGRVTVDMLAGYFGVTPQTVRRDLSDLADLGKLQRVHGGAILPTGLTNLGYANRRSLATRAKVRIAAACAQTIPDQTAVFIGIGTTAEAVARALRRKRNLLVVTNNLNVARTLVEYPDCEVVATGGAVRRADAGLVGALAIRTIEQFRFDHAVLGCSAIDPGGDVLEFDVDEAMVNRTIVERAAVASLVADATKFARSAPMRVAPLSAFDKFFTDAPVPPAVAALCRDGGTEVRLCPG